MLKITPRVQGLGVSPDETASSSVAISALKNRIHVTRGSIVIVYARKSADASWELMATIDNSLKSFGSGGLLTTPPAVYSHFDFLSNNSRAVRVIALPDVAEVAPVSSVPINEASALDSRLDSIEAFSFRQEAPFVLPDNVSNGVGIALPFNAEGEAVLVFLDVGDGTGLNLVHSTGYTISGFNITFGDASLSSGTKIYVNRWSSDL